MMVHNDHKSRSPVSHVLKVTIKTFSHIAFKLYEPPDTNIAKSNVLSMG